MVGREHGSSFPRAPPNNERCESAVEHSRALFEVAKISFMSIMVENFRSLLTANSKIEFYCQHCVNYKIFGRRQKAGSDVPRAVGKFCIKCARRFWVGKYQFNGVSVTRR